MEVDLIQLYVDMISVKDKGECKNSDLHFFGMGAIQWTGNRGEKLLTRYLEEAGYDAESAEFQEIIQRCSEGDSYEEVYLTEAQVRNAEMQNGKYWEYWDSAPWQADVWDLLKIEKETIGYTPYELYSYSQDDSVDYLSDMDLMSLEDNCAEEENFEIQYWSINGKVF